MNLSIFDSFKWGLFLKILLFFIFILVFQIFTGYFILKRGITKRTENSINTTVNQVKKDLIYSNGKWDMSRYNSDPNTPSPNSTNSSPLYIVTTEGFVIERSRPIDGLLDSADFNHLLEFETTHELTTPTNEKWRIISKPIRNNKKVIGVVTSAYYIIRSRPEEDIDRELKSSIQSINSNIKVVNNHINLESFDFKNVAYDISYSVVDKFNKVIITNGRMPLFLDVSYVSPELTAGMRIVKNKADNENYLVMSKPLVDNKGLPVGVVVSGRSISSLFAILNNYLVFSLLICTFIVIPLALAIIYYFRRDLIILLSESKKQTFRRIYFDSKKSLIIIDNNVIKIPYSSNQYYLCKTIFAAPQKMWETDEILERFGDSEIFGRTRRIYDAMLAVNKKLNLKLILHEDKVFRFNPLYLSKLKSI